MSFLASYVREQKRYTKTELQKLFDFTTQEVENFIRLLKAYGVLKSVKNTPNQLDLTELTETDLAYVDVSSDNGACYYVFTYVGVITVGSRVIKCFPKYISHTEHPVEQMKQVLKVLQKYAAKEQIVNLYNGADQSNSFNLLAVMLFLLSDYHEHGLYTNHEDLIEPNGDGEILWEKTVNEGFVILQNNKPYYTEYFTRRTVDDETDYFLRLHRCIVSECSRQLREADLLSLFDLLDADLCDDSLASFGEINYILYRLQNELNIQFNTRKQTLLKTLYAYVANQQAIAQSDGISMYGTTTFNLVWEDVCGNVFGNKLHTPLGQLPLNLAPGYNPHAQLISLIASPRWSGIDTTGRSFTKNATETLIPDIVCVSKTDFTILDAKYYCPQLLPDKPLRGQPGVGDVTKQYLYQLAFGKFIQDHRLQPIHNCFVMPTEEKLVSCFAVAEMEILSQLGLKNIIVRKVPAQVLYEKYLKRLTLDISYLQLG